MDTKSRRVQRRIAPQHPGQVLKLLYLDSLDMSVGEAAALLKVSRQTLSKIINSRGAITPDMSLRLSRAFPNTTPELWLEMQQKWDVWHAAKEKDWKKVDPFPIPDEIRAGR